MFVSLCVCVRGGPRRLTIEVGWVRSWGAEAAAQAARCRTGCDPSIHCTAHRVLPPPFSTHTHVHHAHCTHKRRHTRVRARAYPHAQPRTHTQASQGHAPEVNGHIVEVGRGPIQRAVAAADDALPDVSVQRPVELLDVLAVRGAGERAGQEGRRGSEGPRHERAGWGDVGWGVQQPVELFTVTGYQPVTALHVY